MNTKIYVLMLIGKTLGSVTTAFKCMRVMLFIIYNGGTSSVDCRWLHLSVTEITYAFM